MQNQYHILNGDALKLAFPKSIPGDIIITRECLVDGDVKGDNLEDFFQNRAKFISQNYPGYTTDDYRITTVSEFREIQNIPKKSSVYLWFEDDLFCQVNFWFVSSLLAQIEGLRIFLVRPKTPNRFGFGGLNEAELIDVFTHKTPIENIEAIARLWTDYQSSNLDDLLQNAQTLMSDFPFIAKAVEAHIDRIPNGRFLGRPTLSLIQIMKDLKTKDFATIFQEFSKRESIYGFGDEQVKRLLDEIKKK